MPKYDGLIIDCHIHPAVDTATDTNWFAPTGSFERQMEMLRCAGIRRACGALIRPMEPASFGEIRKLNDAALHLRDRFPDFYIPGMQVHPHFPDESCREIERLCGSEGVRWIGELVGYMMGFGEEYDSDRALAVMRAAAAHGAVVNIHCGNLQVIERLCRAVPELPVVLAHPGGAKQEFLERIRRVREFRNLYLDISGSGIDRLGVLRKAVDEAGADKILFGTDFPINDPAVYVAGVLFEPLTSDERDAVFHGNFERLTAPAPATSG